MSTKGHGMDLATNLRSPLPSRDATASDADRVAAGTHPNGSSRQGRETAGSALGPTVDPAAAAPVSHELQRLAWSALGIAGMVGVTTIAVAPAFRSLLESEMLPQAAAVLLGLVLWATSWTLGVGTSAAFGALAILAYLTDGFRIADDRTLRLIRTTAYATFLVSFPLAIATAVAVLAAGITCGGVVAAAWAIANFTDQS